MKQANSFQLNMLGKHGIQRTSHVPQVMCMGRASTMIESNSCLYCEKVYHELYAPHFAYNNGPSLIVVAHETALEEVASSKKYSYV